MSTTRNFPAGDALLSAWLSGLSFAQGWQMFLDRIPSSEAMGSKVLDETHASAWRIWTQLEHEMDIAPQVWRHP